MRSLLDGDQGPSVFQGGVQRLHPALGDHEVLGGGDHEVLGGGDVTILPPEEADSTWQAGL